MVNWSSMFDVTGWFMVALVALGCIVSLGAYIFYITRFKHKFRIKKLTGSKTVVVDDKAKEFRDNDGVTWWKLLGMKHVIQVPPADCLDVTTTGKHSVEAYYSDESGYQFEKSAALGNLEKIKDSGLAFKVPFMQKRLVLFNFTVLQRKVQDNKMGKYVYIKDKDPDIIGTDILRTKQKVIMVDQIEKAKRRTGFNWREHVPLIAGLSFLIIMLAVVFIFFENIVEPIEPLIAKFDSIAKTLDHTTMIQQEMIQKKQIIPAGMVVAAGVTQTNYTGPPA